MLDLAGQMLLRIKGGDLEQLGKTFIVFLNILFTNRVTPQCFSSHSLITQINENILFEKLQVKPSVQIDHIRGM
jgi:hypothetical protein